MDIDDFLKPPSTGGFSGSKYLKKWKEDGSIVVVLHQQPTAEKKHISWPVWGHTFNVRKTIKDRKTGVEKEILGFERFVSPDSEEVNQKQFFRNRPQDDGPLGQLQAPPKLDPFLLLREYLYQEIEAGRMSPDTVVFSWTNPQKNNELTEWTAGRLSRHEKSTRTTWNHSLDSKLEWFFAVVVPSQLENGVVLARETSLLGKEMRKEIGNQIDSEGVEGGNPLITPYAFKWKFDKDARSPMDAYSANRFNRQEITAEIMEAIQTDDFPNPANQTVPKAGDKAKIRAMFEDAARIDLPWELLFVDAWDDSSKDADEFRDEETSHGVPADSDRKPAARETAVSTGTKTRTRTRKRTKVKPPWDVSEENRVACEDCGTHMHPGWKVCPGCGAEYDLEGEDPVEMPDAATIRAAGWIVNGGDNAPAPATNTAPSGDASECWSCGHVLPDPNVKNCPSCGIDLGDDVPFG